MSQPEQPQRSSGFAVAHRRALLSPDWLGKPVLYQLSYVREAAILATVLPSASRGRRQLGANSTVPERGGDARSQVAS
jgi:hypothetical protein